MVGGSFTGVTVRIKLLLAVPPAPSFTVRVIRVVPLWLVAGVTKRARLVPLPPRTMALLGTRVWLVEVAVTVRAPAAVSRSLTSKSTGPSRISSGVVWLGIAEIMGAEFN